MVFPRYYARWRLITLVVGVVLLYVSGGLGRIGPVPIAGLVVIVVSLLPWPCGAERYRRVCAGSVAKAAHHVEDAQRQAWLAETARVSEFREIDVPDRLLDEHHELLRLFETGQALRRDRNSSMRTRALRSREVADRIRELQSRVSNLATTPDEHGYRDALDAVLIAREEGGEACARESGRILSKLVMDQETLKPPDSLRDAHNLMVRAFREELAMMWEYQTALRHGDADAIRAASMKYESVVDLCATRLEALGIRTAHTPVQVGRHG